MKGHVVDHVQRAQGRLDHRPAGRRRRARSTRSTTPRSARCPASNPTQPLPPEYPAEQGVLHGHVLLQRDAAAVTRAAAARPPDPAARVRRLRRRPRCDERRVVVAVLGPTATGKSALALALAERFGGEIINCDSTAVYRGFDIGTDKVPPAERRGIPHHLIDIVDPTEDYTAAQLRARRGARRSATSTRAAGCRSSPAAPGFYYRALTRGLFPGPGRDDGAARAARGDRRRGAASTFLHRMLRARRSARRRARIQPRDLQAARARARGVLPDRPAADRALRRDARRRLPDVDVAGDRRCGCRRRRSPRA